MSREIKEAPPELALRLLSVVPTFIYAFDVDERRNRYVNRSLSAYLGYPVWKGEVFDEWRQYMHEEDRKAFAGHFERMKRLEFGEVVDWEYRVRRSDGAWLTFLNRDTMLSPSRSPTIVAGVVSDISAQKAAQAHNELLLGEMRHRSKNFGTIIAGIARQTRPKVEGEAIEAFDRLTSRLLTLTTAGDAVLSAEGRKCDIAEVIKNAIKPILGDLPRHVRLDGQSHVYLNEMLCGGLALIMHELATNALKHGALSVPQGAVDISWSYRDVEYLQVRWSERNGPAVRPPSSRGFGTRVLKTAIPESDAELAYRPEGFCYRVAFKAD